MKRHPTDWWSLVFGAAFVLTGIAAIVVTETPWVPDLRWLLPLSAVAVAGLIVAGVATSARTDPRVDAVTPPPAALDELDRDVPRP